MYVAYCLNGHLMANLPSPYTGRDAIKNLERLRNNNWYPRYCTDCGVVVLTVCPNCKTFLQHLDAKYCSGCGNPYPWTKTAIEVASELAALTEELSPDQVETFKDSLPDLIAETPRTQLAIRRVRAVVSYMKPLTREVLTKTMSSLLSGEILHSIGLK